MYNGYLFIIRQTKDGQVKQMSAVTGKKTIEEIKNIKVFNGTLSLENRNIELNKFEDIYTTKTSINLGHELSEDDFIHLDKDFKICGNQNSSDYMYLQEVTLTPIKDSNNKEINIDKNINSNNLSDKNILKENLYLSKEGSTLYIKDNDSTNTEITSQTSEIGIYVYLKTNDNKKFISVKDYKGNTILEEKCLDGVLDKSPSKKNDVNVYFDFSHYTNTNPSLKNIKIYVSNKDEEENTETNIYLQKSGDLIINVNFNEGQGYVYNNQSDDSNKIGTMYDVEVRIWKKGDEDKKPLFTGYSNQNLIIN